MAAFDRIVILTGAGMSAESGLDTFRDKDGIWSKHDYRDVATPEGFAKNPALVHEFYNMRRRELQKARPNIAHKALARLEQAHHGNVIVVTQNIDNLHEAAGSHNIIHMHGELFQVFCVLCNEKHAWKSDLTNKTICPNCKATGSVRPDVVWFGETPYEMDTIIAELMSADLFLSIGTSGNVYPAAGFVEGAREAGAHTVELNLEPSDGINMFHEAIHGPATEIIPAYVRELLDTNG